jgi:hypothetical protein
MSKSDHRKTDVISGPQPNTLEVGSDGFGNVVVNHPDLLPDENGVGHIVFSPEQARAFAKIIMSKALDAELERR